ncbi:putative glutathione S-transferase [Vibrio mediterranei AK1]|nr:putative glutathione S-transferase [Vibrio mediterranei AK1]
MLRKFYRTSSCDSLNQFIGKKMSDKITIFHDPTSEPSRAVYWLALEAGIDVEVQYTWLTRGDHVSAEFLKVNPLHQVPAMRHGDFCLSEATAIMNYLTDINGCSEKWFGHDMKSKAVVNKYLSWYHTNLRKVLTLDYFLPTLLMPAYLGFKRPTDADITSKLEAIHTMFSSLDNMLQGKHYLCGDEISSADLLYVSDIFALEIDPNYQQMIEQYPNIVAWIEKLKSLPNYEKCNRAWNHVVPQILALDGGTKGTPEWVKTECEKVL